MAKATKVETVEIIVEDLQTGQLIKHKNEWVPVRKIVPSDMFDDQLAIYTAKGLFGLLYSVETIDVAAVAD